MKKKSSPFASKANNRRRPCIVPKYEFDGTKIAKDEWKKFLIWDISRKTSRHEKKLKNKSTSESRK